MSTESIIGVEIGGTKLQLAIGTPGGDIIEVMQGVVNKADGADGIRTWIQANLPALLERANELGAHPTALGCGFGGPINTAPGRVLKSVHVKGWSDFPLKDWFEEHFHLPATIHNDTNAAAWGEYRKGSGRGTQYFFYTNMGTGVGGGLILDGQLYDGQGYGAAEFGQTYVPDWTSAQPGTPEKVENLCSGWNIEKRLHRPGYVPEDSLVWSLADGDIRQIDTRKLAEAARQGDDFALHEIDRVAYSMGIGLANMLCLTNVEKIAIGGGVSNMGELLIEPIRRYTKEYEFLSSENKYTIQKCELGDAIVLVGAILLAQQKNYAAQ